MRKTHNARLLGTALSHPMAVLFRTRPLLLYICVRYVQIAK